MAYPKIFLKARCENRIQAGYLWLFSNEIERTEGSIPSGGLADIYSNRKKFMGRGFYNPHSLISARMLTYADERVDSAFFSRRIEQASRNRKFLYPDESSYRLIFGESDLLPGLTVDRYQDCFVVQSYCLGMDLLFPMIAEGLKNNFKIGCLIKKNDSSIRKIEGLDEEVKVIVGKIEPPIQISQKSGLREIRFFVDPIGGQKTGFYFDQKENRERLPVYCQGKTVLDCFSYTGGFGLYAALSGAGEVLAIESGISACQLLEKNAEINGCRMILRRQDVLESLTQMQNENRKFDIIVLDPPALAKSKKHLFAAMRKYKKLNAMALGLLSRDGILFTCSCSHHVHKDSFVQMLNSSAMEQNRQVQILEMRHQSRDHPLLPSMPETEYLKCAVVKANE